MTKKEREEREYKSLFTDERYAKRAWKTFIGEALESDAASLPAFLDSKGNVAPQSAIYDAALLSVKRRLEAKGISRAPMKAEVLVEANIIRGAFDNNVFNTILDRTAGKVKEEISVTSGTYEELTDDELQLLIQHREAKKLTTGDNND